MFKLGGVWVLDLFVGSGVLGLEVVLCGVVYVILVECDVQLGCNLIIVVVKLQVVDQIIVVQVDVLCWLQGVFVQQVDLVFIDLFFVDGLWQDVLVQLSWYLVVDVWLYLELLVGYVLVLLLDWLLYCEGGICEVCFVLYCCVIVIF